MCRIRNSAKICFKFNAKSTKNKSLSIKDSKQEIDFPFLPDKEKTNGYYTNGYYKSETEYRNIDVSYC